MTASWSNVALAEVATPVQRVERPQAGKAYRQIGVRLWGAGAYERETIDGSETKYTSLFRTEPGDIIVNKIWARNGSVAVVSPTLAGSFGSGEFPMFAPNRERLDPAWLHWLTKTPGFWAQCDEKSRGTSGKNRIRPEQFLQIEIPLPALPEQHRLVVRIEELATRIEEARVLRREAALNADAILAAEEQRLWQAEEPSMARPLESVTVLLERGRQSEQGQSDSFLIKTQHVQQGRYVPTTLRLAPHAAAKVDPAATVRDGDILIACSAAGCLGRVAWYRDDGRVASTDTHVAIARPDPTLVEPSYLYAYLRGAHGQQQLRSRERGDWRREKVGFRLTELNLKDLKKVPVPVPERAEQRRIVAELDVLRADVDKLKRLQAETAAELDALLPSILDRAFKGEL